MGARMKISAFLVLSFLISLPCLSQDVEAARKAASIYLEGSMFHQFSNDRNKYYDIAFHTDVNPIGSHNKYASISEVLIAYPNINIVKDAKIVDVYYTREKVTSDQRANDYSYFVKIEFGIIAISKNGKIVVLKNSIKASEILIMAMDYKDNRIAIVDNYPEPSSRFIEIKYAVSKIDIIARITNSDRNELLRELKAKY
jgi:hypothetical protein